ncbi:MAG: glycosyltransferase family 39 protein [Myxococcota bacterium]|nr:glycosyltransferase family 39 protein [Myxococcota bacterium]
MAELVLSDFLLLCLQVFSVGAILWSGNRVAEALGHGSWERFVACFVIGAGLATGWVIVLGALGFLNSFSLVLATLASVLGAALGRATNAEPRERIPPVPSALWIPLAVGIGLAMPMLVRSFALVPLSWDALTYHLFRPARWLERGGIEAIDWPAPFDLVGFYPAGTSALYAYLMGIAGSDLLVSVASWVLIGVGAVALVGIARRLGGSEAASLSAGLLYACLPIVLNLSASPWAEPLLNAGVFAAILLTLRWMVSPAEGSIYSAALVGVALGLACGSKYNALPLAGWVLLWVFFDRMREEGAKRSSFLTGSLFLVALGIGGFWYLENFVLKGNPFYPVEVGPFPGIGLPPEFWGPALWQYLPRVWEAPGFTDAWLGNASQKWTVGYASWPLWALASVGIAGLGLRAAKPTSESRGAAGFTLGAVLVMGLTYLALPTFGDPYIVRTSLRFAVPGLVLAATGGLVALSRLGLPDWGFAALVLAVQGLAFPHLDLALPGLGSDASIGLIGAVTLLAIARLGNLVRFQVARPWRWAAAGCLLFALCFAFSYREGHRYEQYAGSREATLPVQRYFAPVATWLEENHPGKVLAVAASPKLDFLYLFVGGRLDRRLVHVPTQAPSSPGSSAAWLRELQESEAELLLVMRRPLDDQVEPEGSRKAGVRMPWPVEHRWARGGALKEVFRDRFSRVYRL